MTSTEMFSHSFECFFQHAGGTQQKPAVKLLYFSFLDDLIVFQSECPPPPGKNRGIPDAPGTLNMFPISIRLASGVGESSLQS
jgi:hypothetical protein